MNTLAVLVEKYPRNFPHRLLPVLDHFAPRITDANNKVNVAALRACHRVVAALGAEVEPALHALLPPLAASTVSSSKPVQRLAEEALALLCRSASPVALCPVLANEMVHGNTRARPALLAALKGAREARRAARGRRDTHGALRGTAMAAEVVARKPALLGKVLLPACCEVLADTKTDVRKAHEGCVPAPAPAPALALALALAPARTRCSRAAPAPRLLRELQRATSGDVMAHAHKLRPAQRDRLAEALAGL